MRLLMTGASSGLGRPLLQALLAEPWVESIACGVHRSDLPVSDARVRPFPLDLRSAVDLSAVGPIDLAIHLAGVTHSDDPAAYGALNRDGTGRLADALLRHGCGRLLFVSSRCLGADAGAYAASKREAEAGLSARPWEELTLLRPAEVYGAGREGIDRLLALARRRRVAPLLFGDARIRFAPIHVRDFVASCLVLVRTRRGGVRIVELCGPEILSGPQLGWRLVREGALPVPVWWPALRGVLALARRLGLRFVPPDQAARLTGGKSAERASPDVPPPRIRFPGDGVV